LRRRVGEKRERNLALRVDQILMGRILIISDALIYCAWGERDAFIVSPR
jgi:hypothetical protein